MIVINVRISSIGLPAMWCLFVGTGTRMTPGAVGPRSGLGPLVPQMTSSARDL